MLVLLWRNVQNYEPFSSFLCSSRFHYTSVQHYSLPSDDTTLYVPDQYMDHMRSPAPTLPHPGGHQLLCHVPLSREFAPSQVCTRMGPKTVLYVLPSDDIYKHTFVFRPAALACLARSATAVLNSRQT